MRIGDVGLGSQIGCIVSTGAGGTGSAEQKCGWLARQRGRGRRGLIHLNEIHCSILFNLIISVDIVCFDASNFSTKLFPARI